MWWRRRESNLGQGRDNSLIYLRDCSLPRSGRRIVSAWTGDRERITVEPGKLGGRPCIRDLRIAVGDVLECLASGMSEDEILHDFPDLEREDIRAALAFAAARKERVRRPSVD